ncbi:unnamed protein product [Mytilus edulis]|uniref:Reverse transcriptase/retrotransposon-derived protein RNase H-like domain-containing protein n=1 Tax=Mytilus edulis TaxID=6550 RepID=A0A8S3R0G9_MYTED|nr:unnamed protein product [Mytilus edulis]
MESEIFQNMVLSPGQSLEDYFSQLSEKAQILRKHDHELVAKFISGLPEKCHFCTCWSTSRCTPCLNFCKMAEACGYRQHGDSINALKHENKHAPRQLPGKSNSTDSNQSEVIRDLQNQVAILTDLVQGKRKEHVQSEPSRSDVHDIRDQIGQLSGLITSMAVRKYPTKNHKDLKIQARIMQIRLVLTQLNVGDAKVSVIFKEFVTGTEWPHCSILYQTGVLCTGKQNQPGCGAQSSGLTSSIGADFDKNSTKDKFLYITVLFGDLRIAALVDTGSSINVISKSLYDSISDRHKLYFEQLSESEIRLANNDKIRINGISKLQATIHQKNEIIETYIIPKTSHPLILGTEYLRENKIVLDFSDFSCNQKTVPVKTVKRIELEPNTEYLTFGKLPNYVTVGLQGICVNSKFSVNHKFLVAKSLVVVPVNRKVPIKLLNASNLVANENGLRTDNSEQQCDITDSPDRQEILTKIKTDFDLSDHLTHDQKSELAECLLDNLDLFVTKENPNLGYTHLVEHKIHLKPNAVGKHHKPYRLPPYKREVLREQLDNLLEQGIVVPVSEQEELPITSPIVLVTKRNEASNSKTSTQSYRFVCDFRHLNAQTEDFKYVIPNLQELTESFAEIVPNYITSIDLSSGFFQMGISAESSRYTAFNTCFGTYKFLRLPMGLKTAPNTFQLLMDKKKCHFASETCIFLGHEISKHGIRPPKDRVKAIVDFPAPQNIKQLRRTIGLFNWFKKFIPNFSAIISPLTKLLKKNQKFEWKIEQSTAFQNLKTHLVNTDNLSFPRFDLPFILAVDTSSKGIGYMLYQKDPTKEKPNIIRFGSKSLSRWQQSYGPTKLELLGMVTSILDCADYLRGTQFIVECDHQALQPLFMKQFKGAIYERWLAILQQFTFEIQYKPAEQMKVADALSRCENPQNIPIESPAEDDPFFPLVTENTGEIRLPGGVKFVDLFESNDNTDVVVQAIDMVADKHIDLYNVETDEHNSLNDPYDADTDESDSLMYIIAKRNLAEIIRTLNNLLILCAIFKLVQIPLTSKSYNGKIAI